MKEAENDSEKSSVEVDESEKDVCELFTESDLNDFLKSQYIKMIDPDLENQFDKNVAQKLRNKLKAVNSLAQLNTSASG